MAQDITPELWTKIYSEFKEQIAKSNKIATFTKKLSDGKATGKDVEDYAGMIGDIASSVLEVNLIDETLPDGTLYWNIAERTMLRLIEIVHAMVCDAAALQMQKEDEEEGIGIKPITTKFPEERVKALMNAAVTESLEREANEEENDK